MASLLLLSGIVLFSLSYHFYGKKMEKLWGVDYKRKTPAVIINDGKDYVPSPPIVIFGHHFSSIAGAAPIVGAITAAAYGWLPVALWCIIGCIFFGGIHDFASMYASVRSNGESISSIITKYSGVIGKRLFTLVCWSLIIFATSSFTIIVAQTFEGSPATGSASMMFIIVAMLYGFSVEKLKLNKIIASIAGVLLIFVCIYLGTIFPIQLSKSNWRLIFFIYLFFTSIWPIWLILQPRDYLNSYLLYSMMFLAIAGIIIYRPSIEYPAFKGFIVDGVPIFPVLFVTLACGAISGFHSLVSSGTSSKMVTTEKHIRPISYGGMLLEGILALIALTTFIFIPSDIRAQVSANGPLYIFSYGLGTFMHTLGIPVEIAQTFGALVLSAFAMTTMDTALRLGRYLMQEFIAGELSVKEASKKKNIFISTPFTTAFTLAAVIILSEFGDANVWIVFGAINQLLAAITLFALIVWMKHRKVKFTMFIIPCIFLSIVSISILTHNIYFYIDKTWIPVVLSAILIIVYIWLFVLFLKGFRKTNTLE